MTDFGKWVGGTMLSAEGSNSPVARNTMIAQIVAHGKQQFVSDCDVIVIAVPSGMGNAFMEKWIEGVGENPDLQTRVDL